jgi:hypothetical protein
MPAFFEQTGLPQVAQKPRPIMLPLSAGHS